MLLNFIYLNSKAKFYVPTHKKFGDSGVDICAIEEKVLLPKSITTISTGLAVEIPDGFELQVRPRSGLAKHEKVIAVFGTIDSGYRGEIGITLMNFSETIFKIEPGLRLAQLVLSKVESQTWVPVEKLSETERGVNGFGSTGLLESQP